MQDLGTLGGTYGFAIWANEAGEVVGSATNEGDQAIHGFLWKKGIMTDLGTLSPLPDSDAEWINSSEQIVGKATSSDFGVQIAVLWENGNPAVDLNTLVPQGSDLQLTEARNINDRGEIAGGGVTSDGNGRAFLLIPCDENHRNTEGCDFSMVDAGAAAAGVDTLPDKQRTTASQSDPKLRGADNPMLRRFGGRSMPWRRGLAPQPPK
jgi:probable HAF family extracellular repeat protein